MGDKGFYKKFGALYVVFVLQNVVTLSVNLTDNIMLGGYSESALSGVSAANQIQFIYQQVLNAMGECVVMFSSQYWGQGQTAPIKKISSVALRAAVVLGIGLFAVAGIFPGQMMRAFTNEPDIIAAGAEYLQLIRFSYVFFAVTMLLLATLRSVEIVKVGFFLSIMALVINAGLNYTLIYGNFGAPELGGQGAAIGTLTARAAELVVLLWYIKTKENKLKLRINDYLIFDRLLAGDYFKAVLPMIAISGLWGVSTALQTVIMGHMSATAIAANSVASVLFLLVKGGAVGAASAGAITIGKAIGLGDLEMVREYSRRLQKIFFAVGLIGGILLFFLRIPILGFYDLAAETRQMADQFLIILSVIYVGMGYQMPTCEGIIRGGGSSGFVVKLNLVGIWMIVLPVSFIMAFIVKAPAAIVVCCLNADQIFKCLPAFWKANRGNWIKKLTR